MLMFVNVAWTLSKNVWVAFFWIEFIIYNDIFIPIWFRFDLKKNYDNLSNEHWA